MLDLKARFFWNYNKEKKDYSISDNINVSLYIGKSRSFHIESMVLQSSVYNFAVLNLLL